MNEATKLLEYKPALSVPAASAKEVPPLRILLLEHETTDAQLILRELENAGIEVAPIIAETRAEFEHAASTLEYAAVLAAYALPDWDGLQALHYIRKHKGDLPFLLVTGRLSDDAAVEFVKEGLDDYILKDRLARLPVALERALEKKHLRDANAQMQAALMESEERSKELIEHNVYGIFRLAFDGTVLSANPAVKKILAFPESTHLWGLNLASDVFRYPAEFGRLMNLCREHGFVNSAEAEWIRKDGGYVAVRLHLRYLPLIGGGEGIEGIVEDVTEIRLLEKQLRQAQKFEVVGQLAGGIAHDFNNVVGAILGWAEIGHEQSSSQPAIAERFDRIREQADRAAQLTRELLAFARRQNLQPRLLDLNAVAAKASAFLAKLISKDIDFTFFPGKLAPVKADPEQIDQVVINLCLNARDAMPDGGRLTLETELIQVEESFRRTCPDAVAGFYAVLSVSDTGDGMDAPTRERIFEPFFNPKTDGKGAGMGLAIVYGIVKQHGGFVHVYSELGHGSLFRVYLPVQADVLPSDKLEKDSALAMPRGSETVLLAEDHDSIREMVQQTLLSLGYSVLAAGDGEQALRICERETPSLAILDMVMPRMGGAKTASKLRERFPTLPIVFTSGYSERGEANSRSVSLSHYLQKPYSPAVLARMLRKILNQ